MPNPQQSQRQKVILLLALVATLGVVLAINWAGKRLADLYGPQALAQATDRRVWVLLNHELHVLDSQGAPVNRIPVRALGISSPVAALAPTADGAMIVGSRATGLLHVVDAQGSLRATIDPAAGGRQRLFGAFHVLPLPDAQGLVISDTSNHRVLRLDGNGRVLRAFGSTDGRPGTLHFPNGLALDRKGRILLVDTNHHAVRAFTPDLEMVVPEGFLAQADRGYVWPALIGVAGDGALFVSIMMNGMERGRVFKLDREGRRRAELALPPLADPSGLLVRAEDVLVSDQLGLAIYRYDHDGARVGKFGEASLRETYREVERLRGLYRATIQGGQALLVAVLGVLVLLLLRERRAQEKAGAAIAVQVAEQPRPAFLRRYSYALWLALRLGFAVLALNVAANLAVWSCTRPSHPPGLVESMVIVLLFVVAPCVLGVWHFDRMIRAGKYSSVLNYSAQTVLRRLGKGLDGLMRLGDPIERLALVGGILRPVQLLVLTRTRFLVLTLRANLRSLSRAQEAERAAVSRVSVSEAKVSWLVRLAGGLRTSLLEVEIAGARHAFPVLDPLAAADFEQGLSRTAGAIKGAALRDGSVEGAPAERANAAAPLMLSAILPGLGQLHQQRLAMGVISLVCVASWVLQMMGPLIAMARKTAEVHPAMPWVAAGGYAFIWSLSLLDTWLAARAEET